jgi:ribonuclease HI
MGRQQPKFYAVLKGHEPGIYLTWDACREQVEGYSGAAFKAFPTRSGAEEYLGIVRPPQKQDGALTVVHAEVTKQVIIYSDGACIRNPGPGGYGVVISFKNQRRELSAGFRLTTNNRMEILGCIVGLQALKEPCAVVVYSDSRYVVDAMSKSWAVKWRKNNWKRRDEQGNWKDVLNRDLWIQMLDLNDKHRIKFEWVRGHAGNEGNERCDQLARAAATGSTLGIDVAYEKPNSG